MGYIRDFELGESPKLGVGIEGSKHFVPQDLDSVYGSNPGSYLLFVRLKI